MIFYIIIFYLSDVVIFIIVVFDIVSVKKYSVVLDEGKGGGFIVLGNYILLINWNMFCFVVCIILWGFCLYVCIK